MRTEHYLLHILGVSSQSRVKFVDSKGIPLSPRKFATDRSRAVILIKFLLYVIRSRCSVSHFLVPSLNVILSRLITSVGGRESFFLLSITTIFVVLFEEVPIPLGSWKCLCCFILTLTRPSMWPFFFAFILSVLY